MVVVRGKVGKAWIATSCLRESERALPRYHFTCDFVGTWTEYGMITASSFESLWIYYDKQPKTTITLNTNTLPSSWVLLYGHPAFLVSHQPARETPRLPSLCLKPP